MSFDRWQAAFIAHMASCKARGWPHEEAQRVTLTMFPAPREHARVRGEAQLSLVPDATEGPVDHDEIGLAEFFLKACKHAYMNMVGPVGEGDGPALRWFRMTLASEVDETGPARGRSRRAA